MKDIAVPTLSLVRTPETLLELGPRGYFSRHMGDLADGTQVDLAAGDMFPSWDVDPILAEVGSFITGTEVLPPAQRALAAVLFTDLVDSTAKAQEAGDSAWKRTLDIHDRTIETSVGRHSGVVVKSMGDGILGTLPTATAAFHASLEIRRALEAQGLAARFGVHVGEVDQRGDDVAGLAVNFAARVMATASAGSIRASAMAVHAAMGQAFSFTAAGHHALKGIDGEWELFELAG